MTAFRCQTTWGFGPVCYRLSIAQKEIPGLSAAACGRFPQGTEAGRAWQQDKILQSRARQATPLAAETCGKHFRNREFHTLCHSLAGCGSKREGKGWRSVIPCRPEAVPPSAA